MILRPVYSVTFYYLEYFYGIIEYLIELNKKLKCILIKKVFL